MISRLFALSTLIAFGVSLRPFSTLAEDQFAGQCAGSAALLAPAESPDHRKYAPDRQIDIRNLSLDITPDFRLRSIAGRAVFTFKPIAKPFAELRLDAIDLKVDSVTASERVQAYQVTDRSLVVTFADPIPPGKETTLAVSYSAEPSQGLYFRTPEMGYRAGDTHLFTQGEAILSRHWYPCFDAPNEKFTSEITCRVPAGMTVLSNGKLISERNEGELTIVHWQQDKPHVNYLISLVAGNFKKIEDRYREIPLAFFTPASEIDQAAHSFRDTKEAMGFFEKEIGVAYPWAKYYQVCVNDFVAGGMENTSITTLTDRTLFTDRTENIESSQGLMAHELAHQWFGDLVTCKDWSHLWLNEGFATYYAHLFDGHKNGRDAMLYGLYRDAQGFIDRTDDTKPIVDRKYDHPDEQFSYLAYPKGGWVLHMLRSQLGEDLYRRCIATYLERHQYDTVVTEDLNAVVEELSGRSYDRFFDQWVYHAHHPELEIAYSWDEGRKLAKVSVTQSQKLSDAVLLFQFPLPIRFKLKGETQDQTVTVKAKSEDFYFSLAGAPDLVRVDPDLTLLAKIKFTPPAPMLQTQLQDQTDAIGRVLAIEQLAEKKERSTVDQLKAVLQNDPFYGVRLEAAQALRRIHTDDAFVALQECLPQPDARVRQQVVRALGGFYSADAYGVAARQVIQESNPAIVSVALRALGAYSKPDVRDTLLRFLNSDSYRHALADAAIAAMRAQDDPGYLEPLQQALRERPASFTSSGFGRGLETVAYLARNEEKKAHTRDFLLNYVNDRKQTVRVSALNALGTLGDPAALPVLDMFADANRQSPERNAAQNAVNNVRAARTANDEWRNLRNEVLELKKDSRELKKLVEDLKKQLEAVPSRGGEPSKEKSR